MSKCAFLPPPSLCDPFSDQMQQPINHFKFVFCAIISILFFHSNSPFFILFFLFYFIFSKEFYSLYSLQNSKNCCKKLCPTNPEKTDFLATLTPRAISLFCLAVYEKNWAIKVRRCQSIATIDRSLFLRPLNLVSLGSSNGFILVLEKPKL